MEDRISKKSGYWYDVIMGGILSFLIIFFCGKLIIEKNGLSYLTTAYFVLILSIVAFYQWKDDNLKFFQTELSKKENFELTKKALEKLNWEYEVNSTEIKLTYNKYILKFLNVIIIPKGKKICLNFQYHSTSKTGRLPFFFGISTLLEWKFRRSLKSQLKNIKPNA